jgi:hypothetical protein
VAHLVSLVAALLCASFTSAPQAPDKELVAAISGPALAGGIVTGLAWDGGTLVIQTVGVDKAGTPSPKYLIVGGRGMQLRSAAEPPAAVERYWAMKASRVSPTGLGKISVKDDSKLPMYGIASQERRLLDAVDMGGTRVTHVVRLGGLVLHGGTGAAPYDGQVWSWSPAEINRIAYTDQTGDLWIARADGSAAERVLKGTFTLPAWSEDGMVLAIAERKSDGAKWEVSVVHIPERYRR